MSVIMNLRYILKKKLIFKIFEELYYTLINITKKDISFPLLEQFVALEENIQ